MRILYHHRTASQDGQAVHIHEMIEALRSQGHEVRVVSPELAAQEGRMGARLGWAHQLKAMLPQATYELLELGYTLVAYRQLRRAAAEFKPDVLYERYNLYLLAGAMLCKRLKLPMLLEVNGPVFQERHQNAGLGLPRFARWTENRVWRSADVVLPVTQVLADIISAQAGVPADRLVVVPNGINETHFAQAPPPLEAKRALGLGDELVVGFTGFVREWHGVDRAVRWLASPGAPAHSRLHVVGDGPARPGLERLARRLGVHERVTFTGVVSRAEVPARVAAFDIALQPAVTPYASPLKLFEYLALGKAIVAPRLPNIMEVLVDGHNAALFEANDEASFAHTLTRLAEDAALRCRLAAAARRTIAERGLTWQANARRAVELGQRLCWPAGTAAPAA